MEEQNYLSNLSLLTHNMLIFLLILLLVTILRLQALCNAVQTAEADSKTQALILQSARPKIFSAGLDLRELHNPTESRLREFWQSFQQLYLDLYGSRLACIAAMEGHAPAAGCMLALSCDYRIMENSPKLTIGLNESKFGIAAPSWLAQQMIDTVGQRTAEMALQLGTLYSPQDALQIKLIDEVADDVLERAVEQAKIWAQPPARFESKLLVRQNRLDHLRATRQADEDHFVKFVLQDQVQKSLSAYLASLTSKKK